MLLFTRLINSKYDSCDSGDRYASAQDALQSGIRSAVALAAEQFEDEQGSVAVEVRIERPNGSVVLRSIVSTSVASLLPAAEIATAEELMQQPAND